MSTQNSITLNLSAAEVAAIDASLDQLEAATTRLPGLTAAQKAQMVRTGDKSEAFYRQTLRVLEQNPQILAANMDVPDAVADLQTSDVLRPRLIRLTQVFHRFHDTDLGLRSDAMALALQGYRLLKVTGRHPGLEPVRRELGARIARKRKAPARVRPTPAQRALKRKATFGWLFSLRFSCSSLTSSEAASSALGRKHRYADEIVGTRTKNSARRSKSSERG